MTLTVPKAGVIAGAAPRLSSIPVVASEAGAAFAGLGERMLQVGTAIEEDRSQRELAQARITMMQGLNELRLEFEQSGSPDEIDAQYPQRAEALKQSILGGLSARSQQGGAVMFDELQVTHGFALGKRAIDLRQSERMATTEALHQTVVSTAAAASDQPTRDAALGQYDDHLAGLVADGTLTPEEAQRARMSARAEVDNAAAIRMASTDPAGLIARLDDPKDPGFSHLEPTRREQLRAGAVADLAAAERQRAAEADRAEKERIAGAKDLLKSGAEVFRAGGRGRDYALADQVEEALKDPAIAALPEAREYRSAELLHRMQPGFAALPMAEKRRLLTEAEAQPIAKGYEADLAQAMRSQIAADEEGFAKDPIGYAATIGLKATPDLPDPASTSAVDMGRALQARAAYAASLRQSGYTKDARLFRPEEAEKFKAAVAQSNSPEQLVKLSSAFAAGFGNDADRAAKEIGADPVFQMVGGMLANGGDEGTARRIFNGRRIMDTKDVRLPPEKDRRGVFFKTFYGMFSDGTVPGEPDEKPVRDAIVAATDALYAAETFDETYVRGSTKDPVVIDETRWKNCLHKVLAGAGSFDDDLATGGVQEVMGQITLMPRGISGRALERNIQTVAEAGPDAWKAVSASGSVPMVGGVPLAADDLKSWGSWQLSLTPLYNGEFALQTPDPTTGRMGVLTDDKGAPYRIDARKLASWGAQ